MYSELFEAVPDALVLVNDQGCITRANSRACALFGYPKEQLVGASIELLVPANAHARHRAHRAGYMAHPHVRAMGATGQSLMGQRRDGSQFPVEIALSPISQGGARLFLASVRDISESSRARQVQVRSTYDALVARFGQLALESKDEQDIIAHVPALLAETLQIQSIAIAFLSTDGERSVIHSAIGLNESEHFALDEPRLLVALQEGSAITVEDLHASPLAFPASAREGSACLIPLLDVNRSMGALLAYSALPNRFDHDAMHLLQSFANLIAALMQRQRTQAQLVHVQRLDALGQLTGGIAHDFNNLLTIMSGNLQLLESEYETTSEGHELIEGALRSVTRGAELTAKLLSFARRQRLVPRAVDLHQMLGDLNHMLKRTLGDAIRLRIECPDSIPFVNADPTQLDTALVNLALNARDAMPRGGEITIQVRHMLAGSSAKISGDHLLITVADTGRGMSQGTRDRAMEPFFTTKEDGRGSGLGLSMVHGFAKQSGGDLWIDSALGYGTQVHLSLPTTSTQVPPPGPRLDAPARGTGQCVLIVEDEDSVRRVAAAFLKKAGYRVLEAPGVDTAMRHLHTDENIVLVFSDVLLGEGGNGRELARALRHTHPKLPVLLTSGFDQPAVKTNGPAEPDMWALLPKPYRREDLLDAVRLALSSSD